MTDVLTTEADLDFFNGDFSIGDGTYSEVTRIIMSYPGWWNQFPAIGCGAKSYVNSPGTAEALRASIQQQLKSDGKQVQTFTYTMNPDGTLTININGISIEVS